MEKQHRKPARAVRVPSLDDYEEMRWELEYVLDIQADLRHMLNVLKAQVADLTFENKQLRAQLGKHLDDAEPLAEQFRAHMVEDQEVKRHLSELKRQRRHNHPSLSVVPSTV